MASARYAPLQRDEAEEDDSSILPPTTQTPTLEGRISRINNPGSRPVSPISAEPEHLESTHIITSQSSIADTRVEFNTDTDIDSLQLRTISDLDAAHPRAEPQPELLSVDSYGRKLSGGTRVRYSLSPSAHHAPYATSEKSSFHFSDDEEDDTDTSKFYSFWRQTRRLWRLAAAEWLATAALCGTFGGILVYFGQDKSMTITQFYTFNSITTMLTFLLGVNLAASMRSYAKLLRWLLLSLHWQPLEMFDLILRCDSLLNVCRIAWRSLKTKSKRLKFTTLTLSLLWLLSTLALTLFVGMLGLTYSIDPTSDFGSTRPGIVQVTNFSAVQTEDYTADIARVQKWGEQASDWDCIDENSTYWAPCYIITNGTAYRRLRAWNPDDLSIYMDSYYYLIATTTCKEYPVVTGASGLNTTIGVYRQGKNETIRITYSTQYVPGKGGLVAWASRCDNCRANRWTNLAMFVAKTDPDSVAQYFECTNTVFDVHRFMTQNETLVPAPEEYQFPNSTARMLGGAIAWTGDIYIGYDTPWQGMTYKNFSVVTDSLRRAYGKGRLSPANMSDFIASFSMKAVSKMDTRGGGFDIYRNVSGDVPIRGQTLTVDWKNAILLLAGIPALQLVACILVFAVANRAVIKDDSPLSMAKLYWNLLKEHDLGERGSLLRGDQMVRYIGQKTKTGEQGPMVIYGWKEGDRRGPDGTRMGRIDVFEKRNEASTEVVSDTSDAPVDSGVSFRVRERQRVKTIFGRGRRHDNLFD